MHPDLLLDHLRRLAPKDISARPVVDRWVVGASKPKPLLYGRFDLPNGVSAGRLRQIAAANVAGPTFRLLGARQGILANEVSVAGLCEAGGS
jgi:hypothetical protein